VSFSNFLKQILYVEVLELGEMTTWQLEIFDKKRTIAEIRAEIQKTSTTTPIKIILS